VVSTWRGDKEARTERGRKTGDGIAVDEDNVRP